MFINVDVQIHNIRIKNADPDLTISREKKGGGHKLKKRRKLISQGKIESQKREWE